MMPFAVLGAAIQGNLFALGVPSLIFIWGKLGLSMYFLTRMSSCENAHSSAERRADGGDAVVD